MIGTTAEMYDFFVYASAAGLVFGRQFFPALDATAGLLASFATLGVSFVARPLGALLAGYVGDRFGRKSVLVASIVLMGVATIGVGLLPGYDTIGVAAPVLLVVLRLVQGISTGGEWPSAALILIEHAPPGRRGFLGAFPQVGVPAGLLLANLAFIAVSATTSPAAFQAWGWRIPFLLSAVLVGIGLFVRSRVSESPVFEELRERGRQVRAPLAVVFRRHTRAVLTAIGLFIANSAVGYVLITFMNSYGTTTLGLSRSLMLTMGMIGAAAWGGFTILAGRWCDSHGRRRIYLVGTIALAAWAFPFFLLLDTRSVPLIGLAVVGLAFGLGLTSAPQAAAFAELFPAGVRSTGVTFAHAFGSVLGGGFAPFLATWLVDSTGTSMAVAAYLVVTCLITLAAAAALREPSDLARNTYHHVA
ncbi:MFS transporter [Kutzneria sp. NPDC052558]|uniref:MFS transporter n=1 Tax=Kutzneria sp. NPDC052558 TaxID=3364121 RepID=UPI0037C5BEA5